MSAELIDATEVSLTKPARKPFRRGYRAERPSPEQMARQARLAGSAWSAFRDRDAVVGFLNTHDEALGGRPIDVALGSDEGLNRIEQAMIVQARVP